jgi:hypothetical protein
MSSHEIRLPLLPQLKAVAGALNSIHELSFSFLFTIITVIRCLQKIEVFELEHPCYH